MRIGEIEGYSDCGWSINRCRMFVVTNQCAVWLEYQKKKLSEIKDFCKIKRS